MIQKPEIGGVLLAGGKASRMDYRDKAMQLLHGKTLLEHCIERASPQVDRLVLSVNHSAELYQPFGLPLVADHDASYRGPLLGIYSAMHWFVHEQTEHKLKYLACFAADVPAFPADLIGNLARALSSNRSAGRVAYTVHSGQVQPLFSLWDLKLLDTISAAIDSGLYGPKLLFESLDAIAVNDASTAPGAFFNINSADELKTATQLLSKNRPRT